MTDQLTPDMLRGLCRAGVIIPLGDEEDRKFRVNFCSQVLIDTNDPSSDALILLAAHVKAGMAWRGWQVGEPACYDPTDPVSWAHAVLLACWEALQEDPPCDG